MNIEKVYQEKLEILSSKMTVLPDKPEENHSNTLTALWMAAANIPVSVVKTENLVLPELTKEQFSVLEDLISKRIKNVPLAHLTGRQSFMGIEMLAGPGALVPRQETEILATTAIKILNEMALPEPIIVDACTGAGNIAVSIAYNIENGQIFAADISCEAIELAKKNAQFLKLNHRIEFSCGDLLDPLNEKGLDGRVDLLTCNPPYISSSKVPDMPNEISSFEPSLAFDGGAFGINLIRRLITDAGRFIRKGGYLVFEVGLGQAETIKKQVQKSDIYENIISINDHQGNPRVIVAQKN